MYSAQMLILIQASCDKKNNGIIQTCNKMLGCIYVNTFIIGSTFRRQAVILAGFDQKEYFFQ